MNDHDCIQGPCEGMTHAGVTDIASYRDAHRKFAGERLQENSDERLAYVNHGRWVVDCTKCSGAGLASREVGVSCCFDCGTVYTRVSFPKDAEKIEALLLRRSDLATRNWTIGETLKSLRYENESHGIG